VSKDPLFVERRDDGKYAVRRGDAERASVVYDTQKQAIERAQDMTDGPVVAERVRNTKVGGRDQWRKV